MRPPTLNRDVAGPFFRTPLYCRTQAPRDPAIPVFPAPGARSRHHPHTYHPYTFRQPSCARRSRTSV
ncbi:hypothetical protein CO2235_20002 [Cupriavidus oxalaticus]|uniref:Uncharacterized protein n=1 Tax=Cupriavidus oxalaticus TaxID=96344 RepID=A0A976BCG0_9BURK|nr:hypothetical protein CO2235_20002 [Cupriavidus oxalaticus]